MKKKTLEDDPERTLIKEEEGSADVERGETPSLSAEQGNAGQDGTIPRNTASPGVGPCGSG